MGADPVLIRRRRGVWAAPAVSGYSQEAELQQILFEHPELLPGVDAGARACREFESGVGPADVVVVTDDGRLIVVECKLAYNRQARREIIGQVLDYASRIWSMGIEEFEARWQAVAGAPAFEGFGVDASEVRRGVEKALRDGSFTLVLAVDAINDDLRRIVEYLNAITRDDVAVVAFEAARILDDDVEILMPRVYGAELAAAKERRRPSTSWTEDEFLRAVEQEGKDVTESVRTFLDQARRLGYIVYNGTASRPNVILGIEGFGYWPVSIYTAPVRVRLRLHDITDARGAEVTTACVQPLLDLPEVDLDRAKPNVRRKLTLPATLLTDPGARQQVLEALRVLADAAGKDTE
jgi:hypothetical protein